MEVLGYSELMKIPGQLGYLYSQDFISKLKQRKKQMYLERPISIDGSPELRKDRREALQTNGPTQGSAGPNSPWGWTGGGNEVFDLG